MADQTDDTEPDGDEDDNPNEGRDQEIEQEARLAQQPVSHDGPATSRTAAALIDKRVG